MEKLSTIEEVVDLVEHRIEADTELYQSDRGLPDDYFRGCIDTYIGVLNNIAPDVAKKYHGFLGKLGLEPQ